MSEAKILKHDPLSETEAILRQDFYGVDERRSVRRPAPPTKPRPTHYKVVCISLYTKDIEALEATVAELKRRGYTKANKSQLIRYALSQLDIDKLPPPNP
ncbi:MAG TPA: hypothetical protein VK698_36890 [Kofleriaceae bacterium]|nr:hypothetical protein [Kofleriaceae bacterium]